MIETRFNARQIPPRQPRLTSFWLKSLRCSEADLRSLGLVAGHSAVSGSIHYTEIATSRSRARQTCCAAAGCHKLPPARMGDN